MRAFEYHLREAAYPAMGGQIIDGTLMSASKPRKRDYEKAVVKTGTLTTQICHDKPDQTHQKYIDARWRSSEAAISAIALNRTGIAGSHLKVLAQ